MLRLGSFTGHDCSGWSRRSLLQVGLAGALEYGSGGILTGGALRAEGEALRPNNCIFIFLTGGPSHFETFDPKPEAPDAVRGPYGAISTSVPGTRFCELLPRTSKIAHHFAVVRSLSHSNAGHNSTAMAAGFEGGNTHLGAVAAKLQPSTGVMPPFVHVGSRIGNGSIEGSASDMAGGGTLGTPFEPLVVRDPTGKKVDLKEFSLQPDLTADRFGHRRELLASVDRWREAVSTNTNLDKVGENYRRAIDLLTSSRVREAFDVTREQERTRMRYGANFFGQSCLMARRLVEAGTRFVQVKWYDCVAFDAWDVHGAELPGMSRMEQQLCPRFDQGFSALIEDLHDRGLLATTLVVVVGEFGRTPQINRFGARDHWPYAFSGVLAGAGVPGGQIVGASDAKGAYPAHRPVKPEEFAATIYRRMGIDVVGDLRVRPFIKDATPIGELV
jgi:hypothetical protein